MTDHHIIFGDALEVLRGMPVESVDCAFTSPPYWGLRSYSDDPRELGKEATPEGYVARLVEVFAEVRRVLKPAGTLLLNLGDTYAAQRGGTYQPAETLAGGSGGKMPDGSHTNRGRGDDYVPSRNASAIGLKHKDLVMIPARVALALQADGWWLRADIIWAKGLSGEATHGKDAWCGSVMPESVEDRPNKNAHEHLFLLAKSERYWYDHYAVQEDGKYPAGTRAAKGGQQRADEEGVNARPTEYAEYSGKRNLRNVLTVSPRGFNGAHFAVFPVELPLMLLPAICPPKVCAECGVAWEHRVEREAAINAEPTEGKQADLGKRTYTGFNARWDANKDRGGRDLGYHPACFCNAPAIPGTVLDPFCGSGTVAQAARKLKRRSIGIELNPEYEAVMRERLGLAETALFEDVEFITEEAMNDAP